MTYDVYITHDTHADEANPDTNYGSNDRFDLEGQDGTRKYGFIYFPINSIDANTGIKAELRMETAGIIFKDGTINYYSIDSSFDESTLTWNNKPSVSTTGLSGGFPNPESLGIIDITLTQYVASLIDGTFDNNGIIFIFDLDDPNDTSFFSSECSSSYMPPNVRIYEHSDYGYNYTTPNFDRYDGNPYYTTLNAYVEQLYTTQSDPYETRFNIRTPWSSTIHEEFLDEGETVTYTQSGSGYTEYYIVEYVFTTYDSEIGYNPVMKAYWYRDYDDSYVSLDGDDDNNGFDWDNAYRTVTKGTTEVKDGSTVYIDDGVYGNETSPFPNNKSCNFELRNSMAAISASNDVTIGNNTATDKNVGSNEYVILDTDHQAVTDMTINGFSLAFYDETGQTTNFKIIILEEVSTGIYEIVDMSKEYSITDSSNISYLPIEINIYTGQYFAMHCNPAFIPLDYVSDGDGTMNAWGTFSSPYYSDPQIGDQLDINDADFTSSGSWSGRSHLGIFGHGVEI